MLVVSIEYTWERYNKNTQTSRTDNIKNIFSQLHHSSEPYDGTQILCHFKTLRVAAANVEVPVLDW